MVKNFFANVLELVKIIIIAALIIFPIRWLVIQPFYVKGASMEPNFYDKEYLIIDEISYRFNQPQRGDIVVFRYPKDPQEYFIKRVIGLPGEKVQLKNGDIYITAKGKTEEVKLDEPYLPVDLKTYSLNEEPVELGPSQYFFLGDNRNASKDSRYFGPVDKSFVIGKVWLRGWPFDRAKVFHMQQYNFQ
ncbi:MAG: signal peptidase I [Candidatus Falkowbacteria bacterium]